MGEVYDGSPVVDQAEVVACSDSRVSVGGRILVVVTWICRASLGNDTCRHCCNHAVARVGEGRIGEMVDTCRSETVGFRGVDKNP